MIMLLRFFVENYLSFREKTEFSMLPGKSRSHPHHIIPKTKRGELTALKSAVIYGANASGKSNLLKAMQFAQQLITQGTRPRAEIPVRPFKLDRACADTPSIFEFEFKIESGAYNYGFSADSRKIHEEWLYRITATSQRPIFERRTDNEETTVTFSDIPFVRNDDEKFLEFVARGTRINQLFLTECDENAVKYFEDVFGWFARSLVFVFPQSKMLSIDVFADDQFRDELMELLGLFDTGISDIKLREFDFETSEIIPSDLKKHVQRTLLRQTQHIGATAHNQLFLFSLVGRDEIKSQELTTMHMIPETEEQVEFSIADESDGTRRLFDLIPGIMSIMSRGVTYLIDELDRSLHPNLCYQLLQLVLNQKEVKSSQLIVTTHESSLLDLDLLRRDEIWFLEKDKRGASTAYSLEEFAPRHDKDIKKGYLLGRFGAIPFLKAVDQVAW
jgi:uncharacterized protein